MSSPLLLKNYECECFSGRGVGLQGLAHLLVINPVGPAPPPYGIVGCPQAWALCSVVSHFLRLPAHPKTMLGEHSLKLPMGGRSDKSTEMLKRRT